MDKLRTSGLPISISHAPSTVFSQVKHGSLCSIHNILETSSLHLRNRILCSDYFLQSLSADSVLKHRCQEVRTLYDISLQSTCVDHGRGTNCFNVPDP